MWRVSFIHPCTIYRFFMHSILFLRWFFGTINRREAEEYLMAHTNARGTFLVRESEQNPGGFALSIKDWDQERSYHVKHYKIKPLDNNRSAPADNLQTSKTGFIFVQHLRGFLGSCAIWKIAFYPRLDKCHRRSQIFPVAFRRFWQFRSYGII